MKDRGFPFYILILVFVSGVSFAQNKESVKKDDKVESDQQINDFSLAGYGEKGKKSWDLAGRSADIFTDVVKLNDVKGNLYGKEENVNLVADRGDFNKAEGKVHLEQNVVITTSSGAKLTTDSLDWDRKNQMVTTQDPVNIVRENMVIDAVGAKGEPNLKKVSLDKDVKLNISPSENSDKTKVMPEVKERIIITCDGPLEIDYEKNIAVFKNNVKVERQDSTIYSDRMDIYFISAPKKEGKEEGQSSEQSLMNNKIDKIIARGNVKVVRGENVSYSDEATYSAQERKLILSGKPKLMIYSTEGLGASSGN